MTALKINAFEFFTASLDDPCLSYALAPLIDATTERLCELITASPQDTALLLSCILPSLTKEDSLSPLICALLPPLLAPSKTIIWNIKREEIEQLLPAVLSLPTTPNLTAWAMQILDRYKHMVCEEQPSHGEYLRVFERWKVVAERMVSVVAQSLVLRKTRSGAVQIVFKLLGVLQSIARPFVGLTPLLYDTLKRYLAELELTSSPSFSTTSKPSSSPLPTITAFSFANLQDKTLFDLTQLPKSDLPPDHISTLPTAPDADLLSTTYELMNLVSAYIDLHEGHSDLFPEIKAFIASNLGIFKEKQLIQPSQSTIADDAWKFVTTSSAASNKNSKDSDELDFSEQYSVMSMADVYASPDQLRELKDAKIRGLLNLGNTCYLNSVLQLLYHTVELRNSVFSIIAATEAEAVDSNGKPLAVTTSKLNPFAAKIPTHRELAVMFGSMMTSSKSSVSTHSLRTILPTWLRGYEQHDANEFERTFLDALDGEWTNVLSKQLKPANSNAMEGIEPLDNCSAPDASSSNSKPMSIVDECFGGKLGTYVRCLDCNAVSERIDPISDLTLPFPEEWLTSTTPHDISELLDHAFQVDNFGDRIEYFCEKCDRKVKAEKVERIIVPPRHLILLVGRFAYDPAAKQRKKLSTSILFEETQSVPIRSTSENNAWESVIATSPASYSLYGTVVHHGPSPRSGHYVSYARDSETAAQIDSVDAPSPVSKLGHWHCFNDNHVSEMTFDKVLQGGAGSNSGQVYILYYIRTNPPRENLTPDRSAEPSPYVLKRVREADAAASKAADGSRSSRAALRTVRTLGNSSLPSRFHRDDRPDGPGPAMGGGFGGGGNQWIS